MHDSKQDTSAAMYIITFKPKGYIVVSATKKTYPVLAYSKNTKFDVHHLPGGLAVWFVSSAARIQTIKLSKSIQDTGKVGQAWSAAVQPQVVSPCNKTVTGQNCGSGGNPPPPTIPPNKPGKTEHIQKGPFIQVQWDQNAPFNDLVFWNGSTITLDPYILHTAEDFPGKNLCPAGEPCPAGCVAVAMAQIMHYWKYPAYYNWSAMPDQVLITPSYSHGKKSPEAKLMRDIGINVKMDYGTNGSGADPKNIKSALVNDFGYNSSMKYVDHFDKQKIIANLNKGEPVILSGWRTKKKVYLFFTKYEHGHTWDVDGYKKTIYTTIWNPGTPQQYKTTTTNGTYLHFNWGWGDNSYWGGWYANSFSPNHDSHNYKYNHDMVINIKSPSN